MHWPKWLVNLAHLTLTIYILSAIDSFNYAMHWPKWLVNLAHLTLTIYIKRYRFVQLRNALAEMVGKSCTFNASYIASRCVYLVKPFFATSPRRRRVVFVYRAITSTDIVDSSHRPRDRVATGSHSVWNVAVWDIATKILNRLCDVTVLLTSHEYTRRHTPLRGQVPQ